MKVGRVPVPPLRAVMGATCLSTLFACGGGLQGDGGGEANRLVCATACKPSSSLATSQLRPSFAVVSDGSRVQAQAGFSSGSDLRFNVEIDGSDSLRLITPQGSQGFHIPAGSLSTIVVDALRTLIAGATPYVSEVSPSAGAAAMAFEFTRGATIHAASVEVPAPYQIVSPAAGATLAISSRTLQVGVTAATVPTSHGASLNCTDVNGNTGAGSAQLNVVAGSLARGASGVSYLLDLGEAIDALAFSTAHPRGAVARCDVALNLIQQSQGQLDVRFGSGQVFAQQIRSVSVALR